MRALFFFILLPWLSFSQESIAKFNRNTTLIDSLYKIVNYTEALPMAYENKAIAMTLDNDSLKGQAYVDLARLLFRTRVSDSAKIYADLAIENGLKTDNLSRICFGYLVHGNVHYLRFEDAIAIEYYTKIDSISSVHNYEDFSLIKSLLNTGSLVLRTYSASDTTYIDKARTYFERAIEVSKKLKDSVNEYYGYKRLGDILGQQKKYDEAILYYNKSLTYFEAKNSIADMLGLYWSLGILHTDMNKLDMAEHYYKKRIDVSLETGDPQSIGRSYWTYGAFLKRADRCPESIIQYRSALDVIKNSKTDELGLIQAATRDLAICYTKTRQFDLATATYKDLVVINDSLQARQQANITLELEKKYQNEKKEREIDRLESENELAFQQKRNQRNLLVGVLLLSLLAGISFFMLYRNRQKTNKKLRELHKAKSTFFSNISHDFRTPLTLIKGPIEDHLDDEGLDSKTRRNLQTAKSNLYRLENLVDELLALSKLESGHFELKVQPGNLGQFLLAQAKSLEFGANQKNLDYEVDVAIEGEQWFDPNVLEKVVFNLIGNAIKYTPEGGSISVAGRQAGGEFMITITNTGSHLTEAEQQKIFNRYYQTDSSNVGSGIGLALTKELIEIHKGKISVSSDSSTTVFSVRIPIEKSAFKPNEILSEAIFDLSTPDQDKVELEVDFDFHPDTEAPILLLVDDHPEIRAYLRTIFESDFQIHEAGDAEMGSQMVLELIPDIIISDIMMPGEDGLSFTKRIKSEELTSHIPIVLLTAKIDEADKLRGAESGADAYVEKPFSSKFLKATVANLIENRRSLQHRFAQEVILKPKDIAISSVEEKFLRKLQQVLDESLTNPDFTSEAFSKEMGVSRMQLHRKLKATTGLSTSEFIRSQRLKLAANLLRSKKVAVAEVAYSTGFNDPSYFSKCFKQEFGYTPTQFVSLDS